MGNHCPGAWVKELPAAIMVSDSSGNVIEMNDASAANYKAAGGFDLIGKNIRDCHPKEARDLLDTMFANGTPHTYMIESNGMRKMICELPWFKEGLFSGFVEIAVVLPETVPHYVRDR